MCFVMLLQLMTLLALYSVHRNLEIVVIYF